MISNQAVKLAVCLLALTSTQALADILWDNAQPLSAGGPTNGLDSSVGPVGVGTYGLVTHEQTLTGGGTRFISARTIGENVNGVTMNAYAAGSPSQAFADDVIVPMNIPGGMGWDLTSAQIYAYAANGDGGLLQGAYAALYEVSPQGTVLNGNRIAGNIEPADNDGNDSNRWITSDPAGFYRTTSATDTSTSREVYKVTLDLSDFPTLMAGRTYWIAFNLAFFNEADPSNLNTNSNYIATAQLSPAIDNGTGQGLRIGSTAGYPTWGLADGNLPIQSANLRPAEFSFQLYGGIAVPEPMSLSLLMPSTLLLLMRRRFA